MAGGSNPLTPTTRRMRSLSPKGESSHPDNKEDEKFIPEGGILSPRLRVKITMIFTRIRFIGPSKAYLSRGFFNPLFSPGKQIISKWPGDKSNEWQWVGCNFINKPSHEPCSHNHNGR